MEGHRARRRRVNNRIPAAVHIGSRLDLSKYVGRVQKSQLVRQNVVLFGGGLLAGVGGFVYHALAGRLLGPALYGQLASLIAVLAVGSAPAVIFSTVLARHAATLVARGESAAVRSLVLITIRLVAIAGVVTVLVASLLAGQIAAFDHLGSTTSVLIAGCALVLGWGVAIPRGILQGLQRFTHLALNLGLELLVRTIVMFGLLMAGYAVSGAMVAIFVGLAFCFGLGLYSMRDHIGRSSARVPLNIMGTFSITAAAGIIGVQLLFSQDVILAEHYLGSHQAGIYGGLNKIGAILFFLTLSVSQVLFPRVVEAIVKNEHPGRILLSSAGILTALGAGALLIFALVPGLVVGVLFGPAFSDAAPFVPTVGVIGLALALNNLLVQFFMAVHDAVFVPILLLGCVAEAALIVLFHAGVGQVVADVLGSSLGLLVLLSVRCYVLLLRLHPGQAAKSS